VNVIAMNVLVLIPIKPNLHPALKRSTRKLAEALPAANPAHRFTLVLDSRGAGDAHVRSLDERAENTAPIRQALVDQHLAGHDYVLWIDADVVDYPRDLPSRLIERDPLTA
jgi:hypothetical protein